MKLRIIIDVDVSKTMADTIQRNGFSVCQDGSAMQIKIANSPAVPKRKTKVKYIKNPVVDFNDVVAANEISK